MSLSTCYLEYGRHVARLRRRRRPRAYGPTIRAIPLATITTRKSAHGFPFVSHIWDAYGAALGSPFGPPELRYKMSVNRSDEVSLSDRYVRHLQEALTESRELRRQVATREEKRRENDSKMDRLLNRVDELCG